MSGMVGILNLDGAPVDRQLLTDMTESLCFRGPDRQRVWLDGHVGLGHTLLATTDAAEREQQPGTLDGHVWITADARIDAREELLSALAAEGRSGLQTADDAELILHAYAAWGEHCVDYLLGDFTFAIWDASKRRLFCARDHFGVRPFFYAQRDQTVVFSNTLDAVRQHPAVSDRLNDLAIADYLLFKSNQEPDTTAFADVLRLPPAHTATWSLGAPAPILRRYWTLPVDRRIRYRTSREYLEGFSHVLRSAVRDRLRMRRVAVSMSGGLDSPLLAAIARDILVSDGRPFDLRAHTIVYDELIPDDERTYAGQVAQALRIPIEFLVADRYGPFERSEERDTQLPEPGGPVFRAMETAFDRQIAAHGRVALTGTDADALLNELTSDHLSALARERRFGDLASALGQYVLWLHRYPPVRLRERLRRWFGQEAPASRLPRWMNPTLVARLHLEERWRAVRERRRLRPTSRPRAVVSTGWWSTLFEAGDAGSTRVPIEYRYPYADVRVVSYLLAIPAVPWCTDKTLLRLALKGVVPESVRRRKKTPLAVDPVLAALRRATTDALDSFAPAAMLADYVDRSAVPPITGKAADGDVYDNLRPLNLNRWLQSLSGAEHGKRHELESVI